MFPFGSPFFGPFYGPFGGPMGGAFGAPFGGPAVPFLGPGLAQPGRFGGMPVGPGFGGGMQMGPGFGGGMPMGPAFGGGMPMGPGFGGGMPMGPGFGSGMPMGAMPRRRSMSVDPRMMGMGGGRGHPHPELAARMEGLNLDGRERSRSRGRMFDPTRGRPPQRSQSRGRDPNQKPSPAFGRSLGGILRNPLQPRDHSPGGILHNPFRPRRKSRGQDSPPFRRRRTIHFPDGVDYNQTFGAPANERGQIQNYEQIKDLKKGGMSEAIVLLRGCTDGKFYVEKRIKVHVMEGRRARAELETLKRVRGHHYLNQIIEYRMLHNGLCSMILEYCDGGSLSARIDERRKNGGVRFSTIAIWNLIMCVSRGLAYLHDGIKDADEQDSRQEGWDPICHLDIKPCNIFVSSQGGEYGQRRIVLADFGCCIKLSHIVNGNEQEHIQECGTPVWYPPEGRPDMMRRGQKTGYGTKTDMFMLGAVAHVVCKLLRIPSQSMLASETPCGTTYSGTGLNSMVRMLCRDTFEKRPPARSVARHAADNLKHYAKQAMR